MATLTENIRPINSIGHSCRERCILLINKIAEQRKNQCKYEDLIKFNKIENNIKQNELYFEEVNSLKLIRLRSFSHWPHLKPSGDIMSSSGWFSCNVSDRVICIYCNNICHQWNEDDDPFEIHKNLQPKCPFIYSKLLKNNSLPILNENIEKSPIACHPKMSQYSIRCETFNNNWIQISPTIDDLARAGFFFSGINNTVTCFYCNGSLQNWGIDDKPIIEHVRWFPYCQYAKLLCGENLYKKIQISKKQNQKKIIFDQTNLNRLVAARLDLPIVKRLLSIYKLSIIQRCIEDQLRIKQNDFVSDGDLFIACLILQKQINIIQGNKDKLIIPSNISEISNDKLIESKTSLLLKKEDNYCLICLCEDKQIACMPCGHLCACVPCAHSLHSCPICRQQIHSFIRIYS